MKLPKTELTLATLLADPLTQAVMRSDNITVADTARAFGEAGQALAGTEPASTESWHPARRPPYRRI